MYSDVQCIISIYVIWHLGILTKVWNLRQCSIFPIFHQHHRAITATQDVCSKGEPNTNMVSEETINLKEKQTSQLLLELACSMLLKYSFLKDH